MELINRLLVLLDDAPEDAVAGLEKQDLLKIQQYLADCERERDEAVKLLNINTDIVDVLLQGDTESIEYKYNEEAKTFLNMESKS